MRWRLIVQGVHLERKDPIGELRRLGQSVWLDQIDRTMIRSGRLARYRDAGVSGITANPTIFAKALETSDAYADEIARRLDAGQQSESIVWDLLIDDVQAAADVLRPVYDHEHGGDGFVSIEVSPEIAGDTDRTIAAARELLRRSARPNVMVKIPATHRHEFASLLGRAAIANSKLAYELFTQLHSGSRWDALRSAGAAVQRPLWTSTSTKDPRYRDTMYVEELIGPATVNTMPVATFEEFRDHGKAELTLQKDVDGARHVLDRLAMIGIDLAAITQELEDEGVAGFAKSFRESIQSLGKVRTPR